MKNKKDKELEHIAQSLKKDNAQIEIENLNSEIQKITKERDYYKKEALMLEQDIIITRIIIDAIHDVAKNLPVRRKKL